MGVGVVGRDRLERPRADGERQVGDLDGACRQRAQDLLGEVQSRRRSRDGQGFPREDSLVGLAVLRAVRSPGGAADVGRQGGVSDPFQERVVQGPVEDDVAASVAMHLCHLRRQPLVEAEGPARLRPAAGSGQRLPAAAAGLGLSQQEDLGQAIFRVAPEEPRRAHPDVVAHEKVARPEEVRQIPEAAVRDGARRPVEPEEPAGAARPRLLGDPVHRKLVVEEIDAHAR